MTHPPDTDLHLIARVKDPSDGAAWAEFMAIYRPVVYRLARRQGLQHSDAEDLAQQVFLSIARAIDDWQPGPGQPPFRALLFRISRNAILNAITRRRPDAASGSTTEWSMLAEQPAPDTAGSAVFLREGRREAFRWAAAEIRAEFSPATWKLFWETAVNGRDAADVAAAELCSTGAVYMARWRVMRRLKEKVQEATARWE
jgi:RNA polymerase sigma-70 factor (ECF subfamily)